MEPKYPLFIKQLLLILFCMPMSLFAQDTDTYMVQIAAYGERRSQAYFQKRGIDRVSEKIELSTLYKYFLADTFNNREAAEKVQETIKQQGFFSFARVINITELEDLCSSSCNRSVPMTSVMIISQDEIIRVRNVFFGFDSDLLNREGREELEKLAVILVENTTYLVEVHAHTDAVGDNTYNLNLSERRKNRVINYLKYLGVPPFQIESYVYGEESPIALNQKNGMDVPAGRRYNRRVELKVKENSKLLDVVEDIIVPENLRKID